MHMSIVLFGFRFNYLNIWQKWHTTFCTGRQKSDASENGVEAVEKVFLYVFRPNNPHESLTIDNKNNIESIDIN